MQTEIKNGIIVTIDQVIFEDNAKSCANKQGEHKKISSSGLDVKKNITEASSYDSKAKIPFPLGRIHICCLLCRPNTQLCCGDEHLDFYIYVAILFVTNLTP